MGLAYNHLSRRGQQLRAERTPLTASLKAIGNWNGHLAVGIVVFSYVARAFDLRLGVLAAQLFFLLPFLVGLAVIAGIAQDVKLVPPLAITLVLVFCALFSSSPGIWPIGHGNYANAEFMVACLLVYIGLATVKTPKWVSWLPLIAMLALACLL